jgi:Arc/MetJ-type ribon-helix-helix transcriptional regulator
MILASQRIWERRGRSLPYFPFWNLKFNDKSAPPLRVQAVVLLLSAQFESDMAVRKPRSRMISVRLSEEEYSALRELCSATGARSVSDITRDAMRVLLDDVNRVNTAGSRWDEFRSQMRNLDKRIEQLAAEITTFKTDDNH